MPLSLPSAPDLLAVVREFLENDILPAAGLDDDKRFNVRVAVNLLATVERELRLGPEHCTPPAGSDLRCVRPGDVVVTKGVPIQAAMASAQVFRHRRSDPPIDR